MIYRRETIIESGHFDVGEPGSRGIRILGVPSKMDPVEDRLIELDELLPTETEPWGSLGPPPIGRFRFIIEFEPNDENVVDELVTVIGPMAEARGLKVDEERVQEARDYVKGSLPSPTFRVPEPGAGVNGFTVPPGDYTIGELVKELQRAGLDCSTVPEGMVFLPYRSKEALPLGSVFELPTELPLAQIRQHQFYPAGEFREGEH